MLREYCDKCEKEIDRSFTDAKKRIVITLPDEGFCEAQCSFVVCRECYEKIGIKKQ